MLERETTQLAAAVRSAVTTHRREHPDIVRQLVWVRRRDHSLKYSTDFGFANVLPERFEKDDWDWRDYQEFHESAIKTIQEYQVLLSAIGPAIEPFAHHVASASFSGLTDAELAEIVTAFGCQIEGRTLPVKVTGFISGLTIEDSPFVVSDYFTLRAPTVQDVTHQVLIDEYGDRSLPTRETWFSVIGEFINNAVNIGPAQVQFVRAIAALCLFRVGGVSASRYEMSSRHSFGQGEGILSGVSGFSRFSYQLSPSDASILGTFLSDVVSLLPDPFQLQSVMKERDIAYVRYRDALFQTGPVERVITSAIAALEALFLQAEPELTHRLAQRVSVFLRVLGTQPNASATYERVRRGYKIRSIFSHGGSLKPKDRSEAEVIMPSVVEYARECVLAFFQIETPKSSLLQQLDLAMIDPTTLSDVEASLVTVKHR